MTAAGEDQIDHILRQWRSERPDIDPSPMAVIGRILRTSRRISRELERAYEPLGLDFGLFDVLATLRRAGPPYRLSPRELKAWCMLTSGAMTARLDRLETAGYIVRKPHPLDRRGLFIELSQEGLKVIDELVVAHLENEERILAGLSVEQRLELSDLLRQLLVSLEAGGHRGPSWDEATIASPDRIVSARSSS